MRIGRFRQAAADRKRYVVDYDDWLSIDELITEVVITTPSTPDGFFVDGYEITDDGRSVVFYVSGGIPYGEYDVTVRITTSNQQTKEDWVTFVVT